MQQFTLQDSLYQEFYRAWELLMEVVQKHPKWKWAKEYWEFMELLDSTASLFGWSDPWEKHGRAMHHLLIHFPEKGFIRESSLCHEQFPLLEEVEMMAFEILWTNIDLSVNILDLRTGKVYKVEKEYKASEKSLLTLTTGTLVMSHIQNHRGEVIIMKNFFYIQEVVWSDGYYWLHAGLSNVTTLMECFFSLGETYKKMIERSQDDGTDMPSAETTSINYLKRMKKILERSLGNKLKFWAIEKKLHEEVLKFSDFITYITQHYPTAVYEERELEVNFIWWRNECEQKNKEEAAWDFTRKAIILHAYNQTLDQDTIQKIHERNPQEFGQRFQEWMNTANHLFDTKTPTEFVREKIRDFEPNDLHSTIRFSEEEMDFYDTYSGIFSQEDEKIYDSVRTAQKKRDWKKMISLLEELKIRHGDFFRVRYNLFAARVNEISESYAWENSTPSPETLEKDIAFLEGAGAEFIAIKNTAPYNYESCTPEQEVILNNQIDTLMIQVLSKKALWMRWEKRKNPWKINVPTNCYQLKLQLQDFTPSHYRTILISPDETFFELHCRIQDLFGWMDGHLWNFVFSDRKWTDITYEVEKLVRTRKENPFFEKGSALYEASEKQLSHFFEQHDSIIYTYDFGDNWEIKITKEKMIETEEILPKYLRWKWGILPENIGGTWWLQEYYECYEQKKAPEDWEYSEEFACSFESLEPTEEEIENASQEDLWENFEEYMEEEIIPPYQFEWWSDTWEWWSDYLYRIKIDA